MTMDVEANGKLSEDKEMQVAKSVLIEGLKNQNNMSPQQMCDQIVFAMMLMKVLTVKGIDDAANCLQKIKNILMGMNSSLPTRKEVYALISICELHINSSIKNRKILDTYASILEYAIFIAQKNCFK